MRRKRRRRKRKSVRRNRNLSILFRSVRLLGCRFRDLFIARPPVARTRLVRPARLTTLPLGRERMLLQWPPPCARQAPSPSPPQCPPLKFLPISTPVPFKTKKLLESSHSHAHTDSLHLRFMRIYTDPKLLLWLKS